MKGITVRQYYIHTSINLPSMVLYTVHCTVYALQHYTHIYYKYNVLYKQQ